MYVIQNTKKNNTCVFFKENHSMASRPGILTDWPWKPLGSFKVVP